MAEYNFTTGKNILFDLPQDHPDMNFGPSEFGRDDANYYISTVGGLYIGKNNMQPYLVEINGDFVVDDKSGEPIEFTKSNPYILDDPKEIRLNVLNFVWNREYEKYVLTISTL